MFTGIVQEQVTIQQIISSATGRTVLFSLPQWDPLLLGESVLLNGVCSTVTEVAERNFGVEYMSETIKRTTVARWQVDQLIHAEPSVTPTTRLSGSIVFGHVDGIGVVKVVDPLVITVPVQLKPYLFLKGGVTVDGVNVTISQCQETNITIHLIPETIKRTHLGSLQIGDQVNIEADYIAKAALAALAARQF